MLVYSDLPEIGATLALAQQRCGRELDCGGWWVGQGGWAGSHSASLFAWLTILPRELGGLLLPTPQKRNQKGRVSGGRKLEGTGAGGGVMVVGNYNGSHSRLGHCTKHFRSSITWLVASFLYDREDN